MSTSYARVSVSKVAVLVALLAYPVYTVQKTKQVEGNVRSADGVEIAYSTAGRGDIALVFIHGGLADRTFWAPQISALSDRFQIVALDLGGHGKSGIGRKSWTIPAFGEDVRAVVEKLGLKRVVLIGNSLGGPVALEAARLLKSRVLGVVGIDTLHDATVKYPASLAQARAEAFRKDFNGACREMVRSLFHPGAQPDLQNWAEKRMCATSHQVVVSMIEGFGGYDLEAAFRAAGAPIRAINGDLWPTNAERNKTITDFDAVIMKGAGHYPMLERRDEFNQALIRIVEELKAKEKKPTNRK